MKRNGFTLAEILITLGIIGVVAALTAPALVQNAGQAKIGPSLSKFVNTFEVATETMLNEESMKTLYTPGRSVGNGIFTSLTKYMIMVPIDDTNKYNVLYGSGATSNINANKTNAWQLKDGMIMIQYQNSKYYYPARASYQGANTCVLLDIGGIKGKHRAGKEVFGFVVDSNGKLVPIGSSAFKYLNGTSYNCNPNTTNIDLNLACTGKVADNNWKADY